MNKKEELINKILMKELKPIQKLLNDYQKQLADIDKNGFDKEIHKSNRKSIYSGLNYTIGYCTSHIELTKKVLYYLKQEDYRDIEAIIEEGERISKENKKELNRVFKEVTKKVNKKRK